MRGYTLGSLLAGLIICTPVYAAKPALDIETQTIKEVWPALLHHPQRLQDEAIEGYLQQILHKLAPNERLPFRVIVLQDTSVNAFAIPGNIIVVHTGLIQRAGDESELAAVLAHELTHLEKAHWKTRMEKAGQASLAGALGMLGGMLAAAKNPELGQGLAMVSMAGTQQSVLNFSREQEMEADFEGFQKLAKAGYCPSGMVRFFNKLASRENAMAQQVPFLLTHPLSQERSNKATSMLRTAENSSCTNGVLHHAILTLRFNTLTPGRYELTSDEQRSFSLAQHAAQDNAAGRLQQAFSQLQAAYKQSPDSAIGLSLAENLYALGRFHEALQLARTLPPESTLSLRLNTYFQLENYAEVIQIGTPLLISEQLPTSGLDRMARAYAKLKNLSAAYILQGEYLYQQGLYTQSETFFKKGITQDVSGSLHKFAQKRLEILKNLVG